MTTFFTTETLIECTYLVATALFILSLKWLSSPVTARRGLFAGEAGMVLAIGGTLLHAGIIDYKLIAIGLVVGTIIGIPARQRRDDRRPSANRPQPRVRRPLRHRRRHRRVLPPRSRHRPLHDGRPLDGSNSRLAHLHRQPDGRRKITRSPAPAPHHLQRPKFRQRSCFSGSRSSSP